MKNAKYNSKIGLLLLLITLSGIINGQTPEKTSNDKQEKNEETTIPETQKIVTEHSIKINGKLINYVATAASLNIKGSNDNAIAQFGYVAYTRNDINNKEKRPITFVYNGGPGASSIWLHMGAIGPRRVVVNDPDFNSTGFTLVDNEYSILDITDIVMVDPIGTGTSHAVGKNKNKDFWGVEEDISSISNFINAYISENNCWASPKFLLGESYGTFRSAGIAPYLLNNYGIALDGIILVSNVLDLRTLNFGNGDDLSFPLYLPTYAATAWFHNKISPKPENLETFLKEAREFALGDYNSALMKGDNLSAEEKAVAIKKMSKFTGLDTAYIQKANLRVSSRAFFVKLLEDERQTIGRFDSRYKGYTLDPLKTNSMYDPQSEAISPAYQMGFMSYYHNELEVGMDKTYHVSAYSLDGFTWNWDRKGRGMFGNSNGYSTVNDLRKAMVQNPTMRIMVENGYYDLATPFLGTEYTFSHLNLPEKISKNITMNYYEAGHMFYTKEEELAKFKQNIVNFISKK